MFVNTGLIYRPLDIRGETEGCLFSVWYVKSWSWDIWCLEWEPVRLREVDKSSQDLGHCLHSNFSF